MSNQKKDKIDEEYLEQKKQQTEERTRGIYDTLKV